MTFIRREMKRRIYVYCVSLYVCVRVNAFACVCCFRFSFVLVYVDCDHLNLGSIEMKVVPQQKELMII